MNQNQRSACASKLTPQQDQNLAEPRAVLIRFDPWALYVLHVDGTMTLEDSASAEPSAAESSPPDGATSPSEADPEADAEPAAPSEERAVVGGKGPLLYSAKSPATADAIATATEAAAVDASTPPLAAAAASPPLQADPEPAKAPERAPPVARAPPVDRDPAALAIDVDGMDDGYEGRGDAGVDDADDADASEASSGDADEDDSDEDDAGEGDSDAPRAEPDPLTIDLTHSVENSPEAPRRSSPGADNMELGDSPVVEVRVGVPGEALVFRPAGSSGSEESDRPTPVDDGGVIDVDGAHGDDGSGDEDEKMDDTAGQSAGEEPPSEAGEDDVEDEEGQDDDDEEEDVVTDKPSDLQPHEEGDNAPRKDRQVVESDPIPLDSDANETPSEFAPEGAEKPEQPPETESDPERRQQEEIADDSADPTCDETAQELNAIPHASDSGTEKDEAIDKDSAQQDDVDMGFESQDTAERAEVTASGTVPAKQDSVDSEAKQEDSSPEDDASLRRPDVREEKRPGTGEAKRIAVVVPGDATITGSEGDVQLQSSADTGRADHERGDISMGEVSNDTPGAEFDANTQTKDMDVDMEAADKDGQKKEPVAALGQHVSNDSKGTDAPSSTKQTRPENAEQEQRSGPSADSGQGVTVDRETNSQVTSAAKEVARGSNLPSVPPKVEEEKQTAIPDAARPGDTDPPQNDEGQPLQGSNPDQEKEKCDSKTGTVTAAMEMGLKPVLVDKPASSTAGDAPKPSLLPSTPLTAPTFGINEPSRTGPISFSSPPSFLQPRLNPMATPFVPSSSGKQSPFGMVSRKPEQEEHGMSEGESHTKASPEASGHLKVLDKSFRGKGTASDQVKTGEEIQVQTELKATPLVKSEIEQMKPDDEARQGSKEETGGQAKPRDEVPVYAEDESTRRAKPRPSEDAVPEGQTSTVPVPETNDVDMADGTSTGEKPSPEDTAGSDSVARHAPPQPIEVDENEPAHAAPQNAPAEEQKTVKSNGQPVHSSETGKSDDEKPQDKPQETSNAAPKAKPAHSKQSLVRKVENGGITYSVNSVLITMKTGTGKPTRLAGLQTIELKTNAAQEAEMHFYEGTGRSRTVTASFSSTKDDVRVKKIVGRPFISITIVGPSGKEQDSVKYFLHLEKKTFEVLYDVTNQSFAENATTKESRPSAVSFQTPAKEQQKTKGSLQTASNKRGRGDGRDATPKIASGDQKKLLLEKMAALRKKKAAKLPDPSTKANAPAEGPVKPQTEAPKDAADAKSAAALEQKGEVKVPAAASVAEVAPSSNPNLTLKPMSRPIPSSPKKRPAFRIDDGVQSTVKKARLTAPKKRQYKNTTDRLQMKPGHAPEEVGKPVMRKVAERKVLELKTPERKAPEPKRPAVPAPEAEDRQLHKKPLLVMKQTLLHRNEAVPTLAPRPSGVVLSEAEKKKLDEESKRLRNLLSAIDETVTRDVADPEDVDLNLPSLKRCDPTSVNDFFDRLHTFSPSSWPGFADGHSLSPLECARNGWHNSGLNKLKSSEGAEITYYVSGTADAQSLLDEEGRVRGLMMGKGHKLLSGWIGKSCSEEFATLKGSQRLYSSAQLRANAEELRQNGLAAKLRRDGDRPEGVGAFRDAGDRLASHNWKMRKDGKMTYLVCTWCNRRVFVSPMLLARFGVGIGLGAFNEKEEHYPFCPFRYDEAAQRNLSELRGGYDGDAQMKDVRV